MTKKTEQRGNGTNRRIAERRQGPTSIKRKPGKKTAVKAKPVHRAKKKSVRRQKKAKPKEVTPAVLKALIKKAVAEALPPKKAKPKKEGGKRSGPRWRFTFDVPEEMKTQVEMILEWQRTRDPKAHDYPTRFVYEAVEAAIAREIKKMERAHTDERTQKNISKVE